MRCVRRRTLGKGLIEKMASRNAPKSWLVSVRNMHRTIRKLMEDKREYSLLIDTLAREKGQLQAVASYAEHDEACAIEGDGTDEIDAEFCTCGYVKARASLPEHLK